MSVRPSARDAGNADKRRAEARVKRYRPGQVPDWMRPAEEEEPAVTGQVAEAVAHGELEARIDSVRRTAVAVPVIVARTDDPRLRRLRESAMVDRAAAAMERHRDREALPPAVVVRRPRDQPDSTGVEQQQPGEDGGGRDAQEIEDDDAVAARRMAVRQRLKAQETNAGEAEVAAADEDDAAEEEDESGSEYETDDGEGGVGLGHRLLAKPVFVPRLSRETIAERAALEAERVQQAEVERLRLEQRREETKEIVAGRLAEEEAREAAAAQGPKGAGDVDTDDEAADEEAEFEGWRLREMQRIARDREQREQEAREAAERERWKAMSEEERAAWVAARPAREVQEAPKQSWRFLQKYYHRGAFFQTEAQYKGEAVPLVGEVTQRDFSAPTGEDKFDRTALPEVMQVKNFGRRGRTKWTHLAAEDTTDKAAPWAINDAVRRKFEAQRAGIEQVFTKPKHYKT